MSAGTGDLTMYAGDYAVPLAVCLAPAAAPIAERLLAEAPDPDRRVVVFSMAREMVPHGPSILVLAPEDLAPGATRSALLGYAEAARPARPILLGGARNRDVLVDAINHWKIFRVVPDDTPGVVLRDAIEKSFESMRTDLRLRSAAEQLREEATRLEEALASLRSAQRQLLEMDRLATLGRITSRMIPVIGSHLRALEEFNMIAHAGLHRRDPELVELLTSALAGVQSLHAMLEEIRSYAGNRPSTFQFAVQDLDAIVSSALSFCRFDPLAPGRVVRVNLGSAVRVRCDSHRLRQVIIHLVRSALGATPPGGTVSVTTSVEGSQASIVVRSGGAPLADEVRARLFEPFFTAPGEPGVGLGFSLCWMTVEGHGGTIEVGNVDGGPCFSIRLPGAK